MKTNYHIALLLLRISVAFTMLIYGTTKLLFGNEFIETVVLDYGLPKFFSYGVYVGEIIAPILIIIGFRTKISGLVFALNCISLQLIEGSIRAPAGFASSFCHLHRKQVISTSNY